MVDVRGNSSFAFSTFFISREEISAEYKIKMKEKFDEVIKTIENPNEIMEEAVIQCFQLFEIPEKEFKKFISEDGEIEFRNKSRILNISYKKVSENKNSKIISENVKDPNKIHAYEVDWVIFNVTWDKWSEKIRKVHEYIVSKGLKSRIPGLGGLLADFINKRIKETGDQWIVKDINEEFNQIFFSILKSNPAIEYIKYNKNKLMKSNILN
ncbi:MAG: hypothetical protein ACFFHV_13685 [Promethearchaeota archaeon]